MFLAVLTLSFHLVRGVPVVMLHTNCGPLEMIADTGASVTLFTRRIVGTHQRVCFRDFGYCVSAGTPRVDGVLGRDVLSKFGEVLIDYKRSVIILDGGRTRPPNIVQHRKER